MCIHETSWRVLYADTDKAGVVYYGNYLRFFEKGRTEYFRALGKSYADFEKMGILLTVVKVHARYHAPARYDDLITIRSWITLVRRTRIEFAYEILNEAGRKLCEGGTMLGCINAETMRPTALPDEMMALVKDKAMPTEEAR